MIQGVKYQAGGTITEAVDGIPSTASAKVFRGDQELHSCVVSTPWSSAVSAVAELKRGSYRLTLGTAPVAGLLHQVLCGLAANGADYYPVCTGWRYVAAQANPPVPAVQQLDIEGIEAEQAQALTLIGSRLVTCAVPADAAGELGDLYRVEWAYTALGAARTAVTDFEVVKSPVLLTLGVAEFLAANPAYRAWNNQLESPAIWSGIVRTAADLVDQELHSRGQRAQLVISQSRLKPLLIAAARLALADQGYVPQAFQGQYVLEYRDKKADEFAGLAGATLTGAYVTTDAQDAPAKPPFRAIPGGR